MHSFDPRHYATMALEILQMYGYKPVAYRTTDLQGSTLWTGAFLSYSEMQQRSAN